MDQQTTQPGYRKSQRAKQPPRRICWGTRENLEDPQGISASTEKQRALQLQTTPGNNPLKENNIIQVESNCISNSTGENCCWRKLSLQQHSACNYAGEQPHHKIWRKKIQPNQEYEPNVLPVGDHATLGRALRYS